MARKGENIRKRKDGRWEGRVKVGRREDGRLKYRSVYAWSYSDVRRKMRAVAAELSVSSAFEQSGAGLRSAAAGALTAGSAQFEVPQVIVPVKTVCLEWLAEKSRSVRPSTIEKYLGICERHIIPALGSIPCNAITQQRVNRFISSLSDEPFGLAVSTVNTVCTVLNAVLRYAVSRGYAGGTVSTKGCRAERGQINVLSAEERSRLIRFCLSEPDCGYIGILICLFTGFRVGEICALKWSDIDLLNGTITVNRTVQRLRAPNNTETGMIFSNRGRRTALHVSPPKSAASVRTVPLPDFLCDIIRENLTPKPDTYFLTGSKNPMDPRTYQYRFKRLLHTAHLSDINFHMMRHDFATRCVDHGFDPKALCEILGHSDVSITLGKYVHPTLEMKRRQMNMLTL